ncbi:MAG: prepilin-type N-terminal cleavage/methylation domain-containing protein [Alphaproteobacteria bacterium]|nr:prepilin-type N-terminal cleavage/methylation domain-containing protein [Alphaproteobacteria bacterium]MDY4688947.1 prepilin-type N-terminal cleavage/methylation domain-containing protein [Alphaproteobacteria bacterium]
MKQNQYGRSMIEMLGVLAIVGVLSVGGIAGYSKAMTKFKVNKAVNDYSFMIF